MYINHIRGVEESRRWEHEKSGRGEIKSITNATQKNRTPQKSQVLLLLTTPIHQANKSTHSRVGYNNR